jgi:sodium/potassium-transporting ATPase subunit alpha
VRVASAPGQGMAKIAVVIVVSGLFSFWQEYRVERTLAALQKLLPARLQAVRDGTVAQIPAEQLVPGDLLFAGARQ